MSITPDAIGGAMGGTMDDGTGDDTHGKGAAWVANETLPAVS